MMHSRYLFRMHTLRENWRNTGWQFDVVVDCSNLLIVVRAVLFVQVRVDAAAREVPSCKGLQF